VLKKIVDDIYLRVFIIAPLGRIVIYYPAILKPKDLHSDLKRLVVVNNKSKNLIEDFLILAKPN